MRSKVELLGLDADVYVEYGRSILEDEDMDVEERVQSVVSIFSSAADRLVDDALLAKHLDEPEMVAAVRGILEGTKQQQEQAEELKRAEIAMRDMQLREQEKRQAELFREKELEKARARQNMTPEELAAREKLISAYGFSAISEFDEDGNIVKMADKVSVSLDRCHGNQRLTDARRTRRRPIWRTWAPTPTRRVCIRPRPTCASK